MGTLTVTIKCYSFVTKTFQSKVTVIGHFRVPLFLCFKASLSAKPFL